MSETVQEVRKDLSDYYSQIFEDFGMSPTMIQIYLSLFFSREPLGLQEISKDTGYSISTVSQTGDLLDKYTDVRKFKKPGSKKIYYECTHDIKKAVRKKMTGQRELIQGVIKVLEKSESKLDKEKDAEATWVKENLTKLKKDYVRVDKMLGVLESMHLIG